MKAIITKPPGGWGSTRCEEVADPIGETGQVLVAIRAAGTNPADDFQIEGRYPGGPKPPFIAGRDAAGVVVSSGNNDLFPVGTKVVALQSSATNLRNGTFCERRWFHTEVLAPLPAGWSFVEGAAAPLVYLTAWSAILDHGLADGAVLKSPRRLDGKTVAVTGASGGVGSAAVQLALSLGATVVAFSRSEAKRNRLKELGAHHIFDPAAAQLKDQVFSAIGRKGVDLVVETVGGPFLSTAVHLLADHGRVCVVGVLAGVEGSIPIPSLMFKRASIVGILVSDYSSEQARQAWEGIVTTLQRSSQRPIIDQTFSLADYEQAFTRLRSSPFGKVVLTLPETSDAV